MATLASTVQCPSIPATWNSGGVEFYPFFQFAFVSLYVTLRGTSANAHLIHRTHLDATANHIRFTARVSIHPRTLDQPILPQVAAGLPRAMNACIDQYGPLVWSIARRFLKQSAEAEDLVQEVFTEVWKKAASFDPSLASEASFIGLIARRRAIDYLRRHGRLPTFESLDAAESLPLPTSQNSSFQGDPEAVKSSLAKLPQDTRELFQLFFENGFTHPEIAEKTGIPLGTVKTRLRRGLVLLRDQFKRPESNRNPMLS